MRLSAATLGVPLGHRLLHRDRTAHRVDYTGQLDEHAVAGGLDDAALCSAIFGSRISRQSALRRSSVPSSSAPISREHLITGGQERGEMASCSHPSGSPALRRPVSQIAINAGENIRDQKALYRAIVSPG